MRINDTTITFFIALIFPINISYAQVDQIPPQALELIKEFEGFSTTGYPDPGNGSPVIGYGMNQVFGRRVNWDDKISRLQADDELIKQLQNSYLPNLQKIPTWNQLNCNQKAALIDFSWNMGPNWYENHKFKTISQVIKHRQWSKIDVLRLYINPHTSVTAGLLRRRNAEISLFRNNLCE